MKYWILVPIAKHFNAPAWDGVRFKGTVVVTAMDTNSARIKVAEMLNEAWVLDINRLEFNVPWLLEEYVSCEKAADLSVTLGGGKVTELLCDKCNTWITSVVNMSSTKLDKFREIQLSCSSCHQHFKINEVRMRELSEPCLVDGMRPR
jgi:hypothetical protein